MGFLFEQQKEHEFEPPNRMEIEFNHELQNEDISPNSNAKKTGRRNVVVNGFDLGEALMEVICDQQTRWFRLSRCRKFFPEF